MSSIQKKVFIAMSGGVDSSVAAYLLKQEGYDCTGVFMKCYNLDGCAERDAEDARRVAEHIGIPFYTFDFEKEYKKKVVEYMIAGYKKGITPNPDVMCNREIKFGLFLKKALSLGADFVATGHYVVLRNTKKYEYTKGTQGEKFPYIRKSFVFRSLFQAKDRNKDQSYFLWTLTQEQLSHCLFPIGDLLKSEVRDVARRVGLPTAEKKDSQGICFLGDVDVFDFLAKHIKEKRGNVVTADGVKVGEHRGVWFYTIGQRHGFTVQRASLREVSRSETKSPATRGLAKRDKGQSGNTKPLYVAAKDVATNTLTVAEGDADPALFRKEIALTDVNIISPQSQHINKLENVGVSVRARVRYRQPVEEAQLVMSNEKRVKEELPITNYHLLFTKPVKFVAAGQSAVFYTKEGELLGGGIIA